jgi:uncharacterized protein YggE
MKRATIAGGLAGVVLLAGIVLLRGFDRPAVGADAEAKKETNKLTTSGKATVRVKPNAARVFFGIQTQSPKIKEARTENNTRVRKVMGALAALKIPDLKTKTSDVQVEILYGRHDGQQLPPITGYRVSTTFTVLVQNEDTAKLGASAAQVLDAALENGVNTVQQVVFLKKEGFTEARRKALTGAVEDALANARALASGAKKDRVEVVTIDGAPQYAESPYYWGRRNPSMVQVANVAMPQGGDSEGALVVGDLEVTCRVSVTCTY